MQMASMTDLATAEQAEQRKHRSYSPMAETHKARLLIFLCISSVWGIIINTDKTLMLVCCLYCL